ncbi:hypothetical protein FSARC_12501 [Fusarium sarcochroum]|uniref:Uncharacterized protein n=1 Tax=Fusarium sarcochroum TaxID=1208366 RepID=A0A8H4T8A5_9HYPO|nr:hypothetical protein FSARC_12501 [Fusarium sarcochroum]
MSEYGATQYTSFLLKGFSMWFVYLGATNILQGAKSVLQPSERVVLPSQALSLLDSQLRFLGGIFVGYGAVTWWASDDIPAREAPLTWIMATLVLSGIGRVISATTFGWGPSWTQRATVTEVVVPILVYLFGIRQ